MNFDKFFLILMLLINIMLASFSFYYSFVVNSNIIVAESKDCVGLFSKNASSLGYYFPQKEKNCAKNYQFSKENKICYSDEYLKIQLANYLQEKILDMLESKKTNDCIEHFYRYKDTSFLNNNRIIFITILVIFTKIVMKKFMETEYKIFIIPSIIFCLIIFSLILLKIETGSLASSIPIEKILIKIYLINHFCKIFTMAFFLSIVNCVKIFED